LEKLYIRERITISEEKQLKEKFGNLGMYLIDKAQEEIKDLNQKILFQKAEIRKRFSDRTNESALKTRKHLISTFNQFLNKLLTSTLSELRERVLNLKKDLIKELKTEIDEDIKNIIKKSYSKKGIEIYSNFLFNTIKNVSAMTNKLDDVILILNHKDYDHFSKNPDDLQTQFDHKIVLKKSSEDFIGGFKIIHKNEKVFYDYTIETILKKNESLIQKEFSKFFDDSDIQILKDEFEQFIKKLRSNIEEYLKKYDRI
jgi:vacuolar-type H+-ATPase subunit E/Vma4